MKPLGILRSPLLHFFLIGACVFVIYDEMNPNPQDPVSGGVLQLTETRAQRLAADFAAAVRRPPTPDEYLALVRDWTAEEALVREAVAIGLDKDDPVIRNRLRSKMEFLVEAPAAALTPDDVVLEAFYRDHKERYLRQGEISFEQVLLPGGAKQDEIAALKGRLEGGADPGGVGAATLLPSKVDAMPITDVDRIFGKRFTEAVTALPGPRWAGPISSGYGAHLVRLELRRDSILPPFDTLRDRVLADWRAEEARKMRDAYVKSLMERFTVELPNPIEESRS